MVIPLSFMSVHCTVFQKWALETFGFTEKKGKKLDVEKMDKRNVNSENL